MSLNPKLAGAILGLVTLLPGASQAFCAGLPSWAPRYNLDIHLDVEHHQATVHERVTWINYHQRPASELVLNAHSHFKLPDKDVGFTAKMLEILRTNPNETMDFDSHPPCEVQKVFLVETPVRLSLPVAAEANPATGGDGKSGPDTILPPPRPLSPTLTEVKFHYQEDLDTALVIPLPRPVGQGEAVTVDLEFTMRLPQKQGRWGQWKGVTFLVNWHPVLAYYDDRGWHPTPFVPWHLPFFNEAGIYTARMTLPCDQKVACCGTIVSTRDLGNGQQEVEATICGARDFALFCSARFQEFTGQAGPVKVRCVALPEHEYYAREMVRIASEAITTFSRWFGPYPYPEFTIVESYFGWNGNQCSGLVMIDERIFNIPHLGGGFVDYLVSHETCHQWWYNVVGVNGYSETWMSEGLATYFSHRLMDIKYGKNNQMLKLPSGLEWLPNIQRETYRSYGLYGTLGRGEIGPCVQDMPKFGHLVNLLSMCYDRGNRVMGMIEDRLGEAAFLDFMRLVYARYYFRILFVADFQHELEAFTGKPWGEFFKHWLYSGDMTDWCVEKVTIDSSPLSVVRSTLPVIGNFRAGAHDKGPYQVTVLLHQKGDYNEQTVLGICLDGGDGFQVRLPIVPQAGRMELDDPPAVVQTLPDNRVRVEVTLPCRPTQIAVDPDHVLLDSNPANNYWKPLVRWRFTPLYTQLEETDITTAIDRWNFIAGPWIYGASYDDPWFTRSSRVGVRAGLYRTQQFDGGAYLAYRPDARDVVVGVDGLWDHWPYPHTQVGFLAERGLNADQWGQDSDRAVLFGRYVLGYGDSLYLPPMHYVEVFGSILDHNLQPPFQPEPGGDHFDHETLAGIHYHIDYLTPYWYPEGGFRFDATYSSGLPILGEKRSANWVDSQFSIVKNVPEGLGYLSETQVAARIYGAAGLPSDGEFFPLGGASLFRGFDLRERQGSAVWVGSLEWRMPLVLGLTWDCADHTLGLRNIYGAAFYDVGEAFLNGHTLDGVSHAVGGGLRLDVAWFSFVERTTLRLDIAKTLNAATPLQFWLGVGVPF